MNTNLPDGYINHNGYGLSIETDHEDDVSKNWHHVIRPDGRKLTAPLSPYVGMDALMAWVDAGCPAPALPGCNIGFSNGKLTNAKLS